MKNRGKVTYLKVAILMLSTRIQIRTFGNFLQNMETACLANYSGGKDLPHCMKETFTLVYSPHEEEEKTTKGVGHRERYLAEKDSFQKSIFLHEAREKRMSFRDILLLLFPWKYANSHLPERSHAAFYLRREKRGRGKKFLCTGRRHTSSYGGNNGSRPRFNGSSRGSNKLSRLHPPSTAQPSGESFLLNFGKSEGEAFANSLSQAAENKL